MIYIFLITSISLIAQHRYDYVWPLGYGKIHQSPNGIVTGGIILDFNSQPFQLSHHSFVLEDPLASISSRDGNLIAYTDGCDIADNSNLIMTNGDTISPGEVYNEFCGSVPYPVYQGAVFLPKPSSDSLFYLLYFLSDNWSWTPRYLQYAIIDASVDNDKGAVVQTKQTVFVTI